ncbi:STAS domain-containing protein [Actinocrinis puniceicyclus]|uniref:STAS domain-containing protein n=1 Tax=Actinocrinis puniceicyclus TaxID=977794 RepID=A0A8J7WNY2_9ACTN|nr:STAS domain-containing protein [Actinocrinis puniceicyclus]MBS2963597.1 STAS domain-containing protein [Actinocrinis puniceicyclus]
MVPHSRDLSRARSHSPGLYVEVARAEHVTTVCVDGDVDLATVCLLSAAAEVCLQGPPLRVIVDLSRVTFFGAAGLTALVRLREQAENAATDLVLSAPSAAVHTVLDIVDVARRFRIEPVPAAQPAGSDAAAQHGTVHRSAVAFRPGC